MSLFQQAANLNNKGINFLLEGDERSAIQTMALSIKLMKAALLDEFVQQVAPHTSRIQDTRSIIIHSMESSDTIVFNQVVYIPETVTETPSEFDMNIYTSAVIFNLALAHQAVGSQACLNKAEKLYGMVLKLLDDSMLNSHIALIVNLGCINNLSQIRYSNGDYENAQEGLSHVSYFMQKSSTNQAMFEEPEVLGLLMNVLLLKAPSVASAA
jgi:hypothetical protein